MSRPASLWLAARELLLEPVAAANANPSRD